MDIDVVDYFVIALLVLVSVYLLVKSANTARSDIREIEVTGKAVRRSGRSIEYCRTGALYASYLSTLSDHEVLALYIDILRDFGSSPLAIYDPIKPLSVDATIKKGDGTILAIGVCAEDEDLSFLRLEIFSLQAKRIGAEAGIVINRGQTEFNRNEDLDEFKLSILPSNDIYKIGILGDKRQKSMYAEVSDVA